MSKPSLVAGCAASYGCIRTHGLELARNVRDQPAAETRALTLAAQIEFQVECALSGFVQREACVSAASNRCRAPRNFDGAVEIVESPRVLIPGGIEGSTSHDAPAGCWKIAHRGLPGVRVEDLELAPLQRRVSTTSRGREKPQGGPLSAA